MSPVLNFYAEISLIGGYDINKDLFKLGKPASKHIRCLDGSNLNSVEQLLTCALTFEIWVLLVPNLSFVA